MLVRGEVGRRAEGRHYLRGEQRIIAVENRFHLEDEGAARAVLRRRGVACVHGLAVDAHVRVDVVGQEAARGPALLRALEVAERTVVVEVARSLERPEMPGLGVDRTVEQQRAARALGIDPEQQEAAGAARI